MTSLVPISRLSFSPVPILIASLLCFAVSVSFSAGDDRKRGGKGKQRPPRGGEVGEVQKALVETKKQLERTRDSLHEAHRELGFKAERISRLEQQVKEMSEQLKTAIVEIRRLSQKADQPIARIQQSLEKEKKTNEALKKQLEQMRVAAAKAVAEARKERSKSKPDSEKGAKPERKVVAKKSTSSSGKNPKTVNLDPVLYELRSAVNYEGRDRLVEEIRVILKSAPEAVFYLTGHADDSRWDQTNRDISLNRAQFLANHLRFSGISADQIKVKGEGSKKPSKAGNRRVEIQVRNL